MSDLIRRQDVLKICDKYNGQGWVWSMIRKEVEELPCDGCCTAHSGYEADAISRQAVLEIVEREQNKGDALSEIEKLPPVNPQPKTGHWIFIEETKYGIKVKCSECGAEVYYAGDKCPRCESKMVEPQERSRNDKNL